MKRFAILVLAMVMVMGMSAVSFANGDTADADVDVEISIPEYFSVEFKEHGTDKYGNDIVGLFGGESYELGAPGIYVSDGNSTKESVEGLWEDAIAEAPEAPEYFLYSPPGPNPNTVEVFVVDANTVVDVTLNATWEDWMNAPTIFRVSSSSNDPDYIHGIGKFSDELALVRNTVNQVANSEYNELLLAHNDLELNDTFPIDFAQEHLCNGPLEFHVNGAIWLPKASQVAAGKYDTTVTVTVAAANGDNGDNY